jgi:phage shock protein A
MNYNEVQEMIDNAIHEAKLETADEIDTLNQRITDLETDLQDLRREIES